MLHSPRHRPSNTSCRADDDLAGLATTATAITGVPACPVGVTRGCNRFRFGCAPSFLQSPNRRSIYYLELSSARTKAKAQCDQPPANSGDGSKVSRAQAVNVRELLYPRSAKHCRSCIRLGRCSSRPEAHHRAKVCRCRPINAFPSRPSLRTRLLFTEDGRTTRWTRRQTFGKGSAD